MTRPLLVVMLSMTTCAPVFSQDFQGFRSGNYTGVNGVHFNPANIADSRYRWDVNLFSVSTAAGNNQASFNFKNITENFSGDSIINRFIGPGGSNTSGFASAAIHAPSVMFNVGTKSAIALTTRARVMMLASEIDGNLANQLMDDANGDLSFPYTVNSASNMSVNVNAWTEFGLSYARVISNVGEHFFKGGFSLKYLAGVANAYAGADQLRARLDKDPYLGDVYLSESSGRMQLGFGGVQLADFDADELTSFQSKGFGADLGFVYEFRPEYDTYRTERGWQRDKNKYKFKLSMALLDLGSIRYKRDVARSGAYDINIPTGEYLKLDDISETEVDDLNDFFESRPQFFTPVGNGEDDYRVSLPSTLQIDADYNVHGGFYINVAGQFSLVKTDKKIYNSRYYSSFTVTPRIEGRNVGLYIPVSYNAMTELTAGTAVRLGPLFVGSGSVLTALLGNSRQADVFIGFRFGALHKKTKKEKEVKQ